MNELSNLLPLAIICGNIYYLLFYGIPAMTKDEEFKNKIKDNNPNPS